MQKFYIYLEHIPFLAPPTLTKVCGPSVLWYLYQRAPTSMTAQSPVDLGSV